MSPLILKVIVALYIIKIFVIKEKIYKGDLTHAMCYTFNIFTNKMATLTIDTLLWRDNDEKSTC